ncbi:MAG: GspH/FimT family pseudopilin [Halioglobus sp.]|nr:GspH/FimT family pseudopilin [Halioglobus sp.]
MERLSRGFTIIELLLVLVIAGVLVAAAAPGLGRLLEAGRVERVSRELLGAIHLARSEAILRGATVSICPSNMWRTGLAACGGNYAGGWIVFSNPDRDADVDSGTDEVLRTFAALPAGYRVLNRLGTRPVGGLIHYRADGSARRNLTLQLCPPGGSRSSLSIVLNIVGRARLERGWGQCAALA